MSILRSLPAALLLAATFACNDSLVPSGGIATIEVTAPAAYVVPGATMRLRLKLSDRDGNLLADRPATWTTGNPAIATVDQLGNVKGMVIGTVTITATCEGRTATFQLTVAWPTPTVMSVELSPSTVELRSTQTRRVLATARDGSGNLIVGRPITWSTSNPAVAIVDGGGLVYAGTPGQAVLFAQVDGATASGSITVVPTVASVLLTPDAPVIDVAGDTLRLTAVVRNAANEALPGWPLAWSSLNPLVARVDDAGLVVPVSLGTTTITASSEGRTGAATVTVSRLPVGSVALSHHMATIARTQSVQLFTTVKSPSGRVLAGRSEVWSSSDPAVATVSLTGRVTGLVPGQATITVAVEGVAASVPVTVSNLSHSSISAGGDHTCGTAISGALYCWGLNTFGQLGAVTAERCGFVYYYYDYTYPCSTVPIAVHGGPLTGITTGSGHSCGLDVQGHAYCWGYGSVGQLGNGRTVSSTLPEAVAGGLVFRSLTAGGFFTCGVTPENRGYCWGNNVRGQLGSSGAIQTSPSPVAGGLSFSGISAGGEHACGVTLDGKVYCWGSNAGGQLGDGSLGFRSTPHPVQGALIAVSVDAGNGHTCALKADGEAYCWGFGEGGALGHGQAYTSTIPIAVAGPWRWKLISAGGASTCGIDLSDVAWCWGQNGSGQIGDGTHTARVGPMQVSGILRLAALEVGGAHVCGRDLEDRIYCWGGGGSGQLGVGSITPVQLTPRAVSLQP